MLYEILAILIVTLTMSLNMAKRKNYINLADRANAFMERHKRNFSTKGAGHDLPLFMRELCTFGGMPYEDWESLRSDGQFNLKHYSLPEPVYDHEESCESCGLIYVDEILCAECPLPKDQLTNEAMVMGAWKRASLVTETPELARRATMPEKNKNLRESLLWLFEILELEPAVLSNGSTVFDAIRELPIHSTKQNPHTVAKLSSGNVNVFTIELPVQGNTAQTQSYYVQYVGRKYRMTTDEIDRIITKKAEDALQIKEIVETNESILADKAQATEQKQPLSKKQQMKMRLKNIQLTRKR